MTKGQGHLQQPPGGEIELAEQNVAQQASDRPGFVSGCPTDAPQFPSAFDT